MSAEKNIRYIGATGRRKTSVARVRITPASKFSLEINGKDFAVYFPVAELRRVVTAVFDASELTQKFAVTVVAKGGGVAGQATATAHGVARALEAYDKELRHKLKVKGFLKRDPRSVERKKFGLKKARKAPTWSKR